MRLKQIEIITKRRGLGKESKALAFKPRNKEHNVLIPRHCQSALDVVGLMQIRIVVRILKHVSHVDKGVTGLLSVPNGGGSNHPKTNNRTESGSRPKAQDTKEGLCTHSTGC